MSKQMSSDIDLQPQYKRPDRDLARILTKVQETDHGCWVWTAKMRTRHGRGLLSVQLATGERKWVVAYRYLYEQLVGPIAPGMVCHHAGCGDPTCVNIFHLTVMPKRAHDRVSAARRWKRVANHV